MLFNSFHFILFFPVVVILYYCIPKKLQSLWLVLSSFYFYACWDPKYAMILLGLTIVTYIAGLLIEYNKSKNYAWVIGVCIVLIVLIFCKYYGFVINSIERLIGIKTSVGTINIIAPIGISFYSLQMITYLIDLKRDEVKVERNFIKYALFASFFPSLCSGPIGRAKYILPQINQKHVYNYEATKNGLLLMMWGFFQKLVISDRIGILVNAVYVDYKNQAGIILLLATILYAFQIYCDFSGYSDIAIGAAQVIGFQLQNNFRQPYFSKSISEFWRRWHISLSSWFRDYVYIPLGGNRQGKLIKYRNIMIVFLISGLWHGASWNYVVWGGLHGFFQIVSDLTVNMRQKMKRLFKIRTDCFSYKLFQMLITFCLVDLAWIFFRAPGAKAALKIIKRILFLGTHDVSMSALMKLGLNKANFLLLAVAIIVLLFVDILRKKINIREFIASQNLLFRWILYYGIIFVVLIFGIYGPGYDAGTFVYMQF